MVRLRLRISTVKVTSYFLRKLRGVVDLYRLIGVIKNWRVVRRHRRRGGALPPLHLRNGLVLHHGKFDNALLMLDEVFIQRLYGIEASPPPHSNMVDIGANIGAVTLFWALSSPSLRVHAYEPNPSAFDTLRRNVEGNSLQSRVVTFPSAVGRQTGEIKLWVDVPTELSTSYMETSPSEGGRKITVPMVGMDEIWQRLGQGEIWLLKVDTEGAEVDILEGAPEAMLRATRNAIIEYHDNIYPGAYKRCRDVLEAAGFHCRVLVHPWQEGIIYASRRQNGC